jgi:hypothetical protein
LKIETKFSGEEKKLGQVLGTFGKSMISRIFWGRFHQFWIQVEGEIEFFSQLNFRLGLHLG